MAEADGVPRAAEGEPVTVLVVEDEALIRLMLVAALEDEGFQVLEAENASNAVALVKANPGIEVMISDVRMPGPMDGVGLARWIRSNRPHIKVLLASGFISEGDQRDLAHEIDGFIGKPYRIEEMLLWMKGLAPT